MSKTVDERVVSMQFDNQHFESNVKTTMSTLDKLKEKLNLSGASKGLENINTAASKCDISPLGSAAETVKVKFSALEVAAVTALANITNSAITAGKNIISALTIDPIAAGYSEYELKMGSIQTIMASTGESLATVNQYLDELNEYSDQTIYSFADMTSNIGKFTNAGVGLEDAVLAMKGISNEAAVSGATAAEASRAMYNFAQALSKGYVQLIDWKSIELANMATVEFKEQLIESAVAAGTLTESSDGLYTTLSGNTLNATQNFTDSLSDQWMTTEVLISTLKDYADETTEIGAKATAAATEVKTFTQMYDALKESAQSGWAQTWEIIVGDFEEAKNLWTDINNVVGDWISSSAEKRNTTLSNIFDSNWDKMIAKINEAGVSTENFEEVLSKVIDNNAGLQEAGTTVASLVEEYGSLEEAFQNGALSSDLLNEAIDSISGNLEKLEINIDRVLSKGTDGDDVMEMQALLKELGYDLGEFGENLDGLDGKFGPVTQAAVKAFQEINGLEVDGIVGPETLAALEAAADELNNISGETKDLKESVKDLVNNIDELGGRTKLIEAFSTLWEKVSTVMTAFKETWNKVFENFPSAETVIMNVIDTFASFVDGLDTSSEKIQKISTTFEGALRVIELAAIMSGGVFGILVKILKTVGDELDVDFWNITETIAEVVIAFRNWLIVDNALYDSLLALGTVIADFVGNTIRAIKEWWDTFKSLEAVQEIFAAISEAFTNTGAALLDWFGGFGPIFSTFIENLRSLDSITAEGVLSALKTLGSDLLEHFGSLGEVFSGLIEPIKNLIQAFMDYIGLGDQFRAFTKWIDEAKQALSDWFNHLEGAEDLPRRIAEGIVNGLGTALGFVVEVVRGIIQTIINLIKGVPDEASGEISEGAQSIAGDFVQGFANGIKDGLSLIAQTIIELGRAILDKLKGVLGIQSPSTEAHEIGTNVIDGLVNGLKEGLGKLGEILGEIGGFILEKFTAITDFLRENFGAIAAIVGGAIIVTAITKLSKAIGSLGSVVGAIPKGIGSMFEAFGEARIIKAKAWSMLSLAASIGILALALCQLAELSWGDIAKGIVAIAALGVVLGLLSLAITKFTTTANPTVMAGVGILLLSFAGAITLVVYALTMMDDMDGEHILRNVIVLGAITVALGVAAGLMSKLAPQLSKGSLTMIAIAAAILLLVLALSKLNALTLDDPAKTVGSLIAMMTGLAIVAKLTQGVRATSGIGMLALVLSLILFVNAIEKIANMDTDKLASSLGALIVIMGLFAGLMVASQFAGTNALKAGVGIIAMSAALLLVILAIKLLATIEPSDLERGKTAITQMLVVFGLIVALSYFAGANAMKAGVMLAAMAAAILIIAGAMVVLSYVDPAGLDRALEAVTQLILLFGVIVLASYFAKDAYKTLIVLTVTIGLLVIAIGALGLMDSGDLYRATAALTAVMLAFGLLIAVLQFIQTGKGTFVKAMSTLLVLTGIVYLLSWVIKELASIENAESVLPAALGLSTLLVAISAACAILSKTGASAVAAVPAAALMGLILGEIVIILAIMKELNVAPSIETAISLSILLLALSAATAILSTVGAGAMLAVNGAVALMAVVAIIGGVATAVGALMSLIKPEDLEKIKAGLEGFMDIIVILTHGIGEALGALVGGALAGVGTGLTEFVENVQGAIEGLSTIDSSALSGAEALVDLIVALTGADMLSKLSSLLPGKSIMDDLEDQLVTFGEAMAAFSNTVSGKIDADAVNAAAAAGQAMASLANSLPKEYGAISGLFASESIPLDTFAGQLVTFGSAMVQFSDTVAGNIDSEAVSAAAAAGNTMASLANSLPKEYGAISGLFASESLPLDTFGGQLVMFGRAMVQFSDVVAGGIDSSAVQAAADAGNVMSSLANNLPKEYGAIAGLFTSETISLDTFGGQLVLFGRAIVQFSDAVSTGINQNAVDAAAKAGQTMAAFASNLPTEQGAIKKWFSDSTMSMETFAEQLVSFGEGLVKFSNTISGNIDTAAMTTAVSTANNMLTIIEQMPDEIDLTVLNDGLDQLGDAMVKFSETITGNVDESAVTTVINAAKTLAQAASIMPDEVDLSRLTVGLSDFGEAVVAFSEQVSGAIDSGSITAATDAGKAIADMLATIPQGIDPTSFITTINELGTAIANFSRTVAGGDDGAGIDLAAITNAQTACTYIGNMLTSLSVYTDLTDFISNAALLGQAIVGFSNAVDEDAINTEAVNKASVAGTQIGNMLASINVYTDITAFVTNAKTLGQAIVDFSTAVKGKIDISAVNQAANAGTRIGSLINTFSGWTDPSKAISYMKQIATAIVDFSTSVNGNIDLAAINTASSACTRIGTMIKSLSTTGDVSGVVSGLGSLGSAMANFAATVNSPDVTNLPTTLASFKSMVQSFGDVADEGVTAFVKSITGSKAKVTSAISGLGAVAASRIRSYGSTMYSAGYSAGTQLGSGLVSGISSKKSAAYSAGYALGQAAVAGEKAGQASNSPSRLTIQAGKWMGEGLVIGMEKMTSAVYSTGYDMGSTAISSISGAIAKISDAIDSDIDSQPTIRPVLDLSDITTGANAINGMFGMTPSVGLLSNVSTISGMMNRNQNGANDDIVSAIKGLNRTGGDTYQINGITYDDGSNITEAIKTLVRAARVERRV